jgi:N-acetylglucosaminyldiphosphoundecaprenol N-acetyl-beta-D-mannosaminyltransferase
VSRAWPANGRWASEAGLAGAAPVCLGGLLFDNLDMPQTIAAVARALDRGLRGYVVTPNVDHLVLYQERDSFRAACDGASLRLADGMPIVWASRLLGRPLRARVAGSDLFPRLCEMAAAKGHRVFLLGGAAGVAERAANHVATRFPGLRIAGVYAPPDQFEREGRASEAAVEAVNAAKPALLFVALGTPKQELWVHHHWGRLDVGVALCCGAAFDFIAGVQIRAPVWMQQAGLEWLWRLARDPGRLWHRYLVRDAAFVGIFVKEWRNVSSRAFSKR